MAGTLAIPDPSGRMLELVGYQGPRPQFEKWRRFPIDTPIPAAEAIRIGAPVWIESLACTMAWRRSPPRPISNYRCSRLGIRRGRRRVASSFSAARLAHVPVIVLTAFAEPPDHRHFLDAGATTVIAKPFSAQGLLNLAVQLARTV